MRISSRGIVAVGLGLLGVAFVVGPSLGQQEGAPRAAAPTAASTLPKPVAPVIGTVDIEQVFKGYEKVKTINQEFNTAMLAKKNELMKIAAQAQQEAESMSKLDPNSDDYKQRENHLSELKAKTEASREQAQREFALRQAESMATLYKEIQLMVAQIAKWRGMNYVVKVSNQPITGSDPDTVMALLSSTVVYSDPQNDITNNVIHNLNRFYKAASGPTAAGRPAAGTGTGAGEVQKPAAARGGAN